MMMPIDVLKYLKDHGASR